MLPCFSVYCKFDKEKKSLRELDRLVNLAKQRKGEEIGLSDQIRYLVEPLIVFQEEGQSEEDRFHETYRQIKVLLNPMTPPNYEIEKASAKLLSDHGFKIPRTYGRQTKASRPAQQRHGHTRAQRKRRSAPKQKNMQAVIVERQEVRSSAEAHDL
jgi:poly(A) polymerase